jgi:hypothetical protein
MSKWRDGKLDLGRLGALRLHHWSGGWQWYAPSDEADPREYATEAAAQRAAERWLRAALKQAAKRLEAGK